MGANASDAIDVIDSDGIGAWRDVKARTLRFAGGAVTETELEAGAVFLRTHGGPCSERSLCTAKLNYIVGGKVSALNSYQSSYWPRNRIKRPDNRCSAKLRHLKLRLRSRQRRS